MKKFNLIIFIFDKKLIFASEINNNQWKEVAISWNFNTSEILFEEIDKFLKNNQLIFSDLNSIYAGIGPGSYLAHRIIVTFLKTIKILLPTINLFTISNLQFQIGNKEKVISVINGNRSTYYFQVFDKNTSKNPIQKIKKNDYSKLKEQYNNYSIIKNFENDNFKELFNNMKFKFKKEIEWEKLNPIELNDFFPIN